MKPELAVLPMDVWADVFVYPWITRQKLAQIVDRFKERAFAEKLQKFLHDPKCGKHSLRFLDIYYKFEKNLELRKRKDIQSRVSLVVTSRGTYKAYSFCEFPDVEMPENITSFKRLAIRHLDDQVLDFLFKIKPLFTNVLLEVRSMVLTENVRILFGHLLPILGSIREIQCNNEEFEWLEQHFPAILATAKELELGFYAETAHIPACLNWLTATQDFDVHGPRFLKMFVPSSTIIINDMVDAVRKQFLSATTSSTFVIFIELSRGHPYRAEEFAVQNVATKEHLSVRNALFGYNDNYVEITRHPIGAEAKMRGWIEKRAYFERQYTKDGGAERVIMIDGRLLTIGQITKRASAMYHDDNDPTGGW